MAQAVPHKFQVRPHSLQMKAMRDLKPIFRLALVLKLLGFDGGPRPPIYRLCVVDASTSISWDIPNQKGVQRITPIKEVMTGMINDLGETDYLCFLKFTSSCALTGPFTDLLFGWKNGESQNKPEMLASLDKYEASGGTAYRPALLAAKTLIKQVPANAIIEIDFLSDGDSGEDDDEMAQLCDDLRDLKAQVFVAGFGIEKEEHSRRLKRMGRDNYMNAQSSAEVINFFRGAHELTMDAVIHNAYINFNPTKFCGPITIEQVHRDNQPIYLAGNTTGIRLGLLNADSFVEMVASMKVEIPPHLVQAAEAAAPNAAPGAFGSFDLFGDFAGMTNQLIGTAEIAVDFAVDPSGETDDHVEGLMAAVEIVRKLAEAGEHNDPATARKLVEEAANTVAFSPRDLQAALAPKIKAIMEKGGDVRAAATESVTTAFKPRAVANLTTRK